MAKRAVFLPSLLILCLSAWHVRPSSAACDRKFNPPPEDDCSSLEVPCFEYVAGVPFQLEYPDNNTRTCYRTCIDDEATPEVCEATLTGVHNQALNKDPDQPEYSLQRIFSPNYNDGKNYRKSTICRYNVRCEGDKLLSYNFISHIVESRSNHCSNSCVDYVEIDFPNFGSEKITTCGMEAEEGVMNSDGSTEIDVEFVANREEQASGFMMFVWCSDPGFDINAQHELYLNSSQRKRNTDQYLECAEPAGTERQPVDAVQQLSAAIPESEESLHSPSARQIILNERDTLVYINRRMEITRGRSLLSSAEPGTVEDVYEIEKLYVSNRIDQRREFRRSAMGYFQGYGELWISGHNAYFLQLGVNPIYKPTEEEMEIIRELEGALEKALRSTDFFDVFDAEDEEDPEEVRGEEKVVDEAAANPSQTDDLDKMAMKYGTACNGLLRSVACAYQEVILKRSCITGERIERPSTSTTQTTSTNEPTSTKQTSTQSTVPTRQ